MDFGDKVISLLFNALSRFVTAFLPRRKSLLISWLQSPSMMILETKKIKSILILKLRKLKTQRDPERFNNVSAG